jgi:HK97 gp10 family phage protein
MMLGESFNHLPEVIAALDKALARATADVSVNIQNAASSAAPVETGFLSESIYVVNTDGSTYGSGGGENGNGGYLLPEVEKPDATGAVVAVGANYGCFVELGTRKMAPEPYFFQAAENVDESALEGFAATIEGSVA